MANWKDRLNAQYGGGGSTPSTPTTTKKSSGSSWKDRLNQNSAVQTATRKAEEERKKRDEVIQKSESETKKYLDEFNEASSGFMGSVLKRFGKGTEAPVIENVRPSFEQAYSQAQKYAKENTANKSKSVVKNFREGARSVFTENTADTIYDTFYQQKVDKKNLEIIQQNTKTIVELARRNKLEPNPENRTKRQVAIDTLLEQNRNFAEEAGGEIKDKTTLQLIGQSVGTALELIPVAGVGSGMTKAGQFILKQSTKQALKSLGKEAALYGAATGASETAKQEGATMGDIVKSGIFGAGFGVLAVVSPSLTRLGSKKGDEVIQGILGKITGKVKDDITPEEEIILREIAENSPEVKAVTEERTGTVATPAVKTEATSTTPAETAPAKTATTEEPTATPDGTKKVEEPEGQFLAEQGDTQSKPYKEFNEALEEANIENGFGYKKETNIEQVDAVKKMIESETQEEAFRVALKLTDKEGVLNTATNIVLEKAAREAGNTDVANMLKVNRLRQNTRNAKELQAENISKETTANRYMRSIISAKMKEVIGATSSVIVKAIRGNKPANEVFDKVLSEEAKKLGKIANKKKLVVKDVQKLIDDLICT